MQTVKECESVDDVFLEAMLDELEFDAHIAMGFGETIDVLMDNNCCQTIF